jgi:hypothetical protein
VAEKGEYLSHFRSGFVGVGLAAATVVIAVIARATAVLAAVLALCFAIGGVAITEIIEYRRAYSPELSSAPVQATRVLRVANQIRRRSQRMWRRPPYVLGSTFGVSTSANKTIERYEHDGIRRWFRVRLPYTRRFHRRIVVPLLEELGRGTEDESRFKPYVPCRPEDANRERLALDLAYRASKVTASSRGPVRSPEPSPPIPPIPPRVLEMTVDAPSIGWVPLRDHLTSYLPATPLFYAERIRFTNSSAHYKVILVVALQVTYKPNSTRVIPADSVKREFPMWERDFNMNDRFRRFLSRFTLDPITIDPESTVEVGLCWFDSFDYATAQGADLDHNAVFFEIRDHLSADTLTVKVPGRYPERP